MRDPRCDTDESHFLIVLLIPCWVECRRPELFIFYSIEGGGKEDNFNDWHWVKYGKRDFGWPEGKQP